MAKKKQEAAPDEDVMVFDADDTESVYSGEGAIDLSGASEELPEFDILPAGKYSVVLDSLEFGMSKSSGNPMWTWIWVVDGGDYNDNKLWYHTTFTAKDIGRTKRILNRVAPEFMEETGGKFDPGEVGDDCPFLGCQAVAIVTVGRYQGKPNNGVKDILAPDDGGGSDFG